MYDSPDAIKDIFPQGAFSGVVQELEKRSILLRVAHRDDKTGSEWYDNIGVITGGRDDEKGLYIEGEFFDDDASQNVRSRIISAENAFGMSTNVIAHPDNITTNEHGGDNWDNIISLDEITLTDDPMHSGLKGQMKAATAGQKPLKTYTPDKAAAHKRAEVLRNAALQSTGD